MDSVKRQLKDANTRAAYIPGGCTKYIQAPDVMWNAPFKAYIGEYYDEWMANGIHEFTEAGNMKPVQNGCEVGYRRMEGAPRGHNKKIVQVLCVKKV